LKRRSTPQGTTLCWPTIITGAGIKVPVPIAGGAELDNTPTATKASVASPMPLTEPLPQRQVAELKRRSTPQGTTLCWPTIITGAGIKVPTVPVAGGAELYIYIYI
jgi:hypothetical protein